MDRRHLLTRLPLLGAAVVLPTVAVAVEAENPELLRLGAELEHAIEAHDVATAVKQQARARYDAMAPEVPDDLIMHGQSDRFLFGGDRESDVEGNSVWPEHGIARVVVSAAELREKAALYQRGTHAKEVRRRLAIAEQHEAACTAAKKASGIDAAVEAHYWTGDTVRRLSAEICEAEAFTPAGLLIKARAMKAGCSIEKWGGDATYQGPRLADAVMAVLGKAGR